MSPEAVARAIAAGLRADRREVRVGAARLLPALHRLSPRLAEGMMARR